ncbi:MAG: formyltetrahydrofolate deformylase [Candidatus Hydrogenedentota bacterium]
MNRRTVLLYNSRIAPHALRDTRTGAQAMDRVTLLIKCPDRKGIVARISQFIFETGGNIITSDQHTTDPEGGRFFMRLEFSLDTSGSHRAEFETACAAMAASIGAEWEAHYASRTMRVGILVSKQDHCLLDLLYRRRRRELEIDIPFVIGNHEESRETAERYGVPFHYIPVTPATKLQAERAMLDLVAESTDFLVLARYMQVLSDGFLGAYGKDIINIHHSFLPSFKGADPYRQAYERGVKVIGATAHYVTAALDEGPIIEQVVERVNPRDNVADLRRKGRLLEQQALANAIHAHVEHRIIRDGHKTIVFQ